MVFAEDVRAKINESLVQRTQVAEAAVKKAGETKTQFVSDAAASKLDLLVLRRTPAGPNNPERLAKESSLQTKIRDSREKYIKAEQEMEVSQKDLTMYQGIKSDLLKGALQLIA